MRQVAILGLGISGRAAARFLLQRGAFVIAIDKQSEKLCTHPEVSGLMAKGLLLQGEGAPMPAISELIVSPGIPWTHPIIQRAMGQGIEVMGEVELAFRSLSNRCIGITGSNGKTTTTLLTTHLLNCAGKKARALGNVGVGLSGYLLNPDPEEILIIELSSFQLETLHARALDAAIILNITPNHLDRHPTMAEYVHAKLSIQQRIKPGGSLWVSRQIAQDYGAHLSAYTLYDTGPMVWNSSSREQGMAEPENIQAAWTIAQAWGVSQNAARIALPSFHKPPHRIEWVADIAGVSYYNDSKSSNIHSVIHAVRLFEAPIVLIVGGTDKGASYRPWIEACQKKVGQMIAYGAAAEKIEAELGHAFPLAKKGPFQEAVFAARQMAKEGEVVLLSPGCSSYDQFCSYEERGDVFKRIVREFR